MTALSSLSAPPPIREFTVPPGLYTRQPRGAGANFFPLGLLAQRQGSDLAEHPDPSNPRTDLIVLGCFKANAVYTSGANTDAQGGALDLNGNPQSLSIETGVIGWFDTGSGTNQITNAMVGTVCWLFDNNTLYATSNNGTLSAAGFIAQVRADGKVKLRIDPAVYLLAPDPLSAVTQEITARAVITSLGAYTGAGTGTLTVTAAGALGTEDGVTLAGNDVVHLPAYAGTANGSVAVAVADSGPYYVAALGSSGASAVLKRPGRWQHGATIVPETLVKVGAEGALFANTRWYASPAGTSKKVGADDPGLYPESIEVPLTLAASTINLTSVPLRTAPLANILCSLVGGTPISGTVGYGTIAAYTPGPIGTATATIVALAAGMAKNGTTDTGHVVVTVKQ